MYSAGLVRARWVRVFSLAKIGWCCLSALLDPIAETCACWRCWVMMPEAAAATLSLCRDSRKGGRRFFLLFFLAALLFGDRLKEALLFGDRLWMRFGDKIKILFYCLAIRTRREFKNPRGGNFCLPIFGDWRFFFLPFPRVPPLASSPWASAFGLFGGDAGFRLGKPVFLKWLKFHKAGRSFLENPRRSELDLEKFERTELPSFPSFAGREEGRHSKARAY
jgi:hypothetical protein